MPKINWFLYSFCVLAISTLKTIRKRSNFFNINFLLLHHNKNKKKFQRTQEKKVFLLNILIGAVEVGSIHWLRYSTMFFLIHIQIKLITFKIYIIPSKLIANGKTITIIHGCTWYSMSNGWDNPNFDFCINNCANVHLNPLKKKKAMVKICYHQIKSYASVAHREKIRFTLKMWPIRLE